MTERRTRRDWAEQIKRLVDEDFPQAEKIVLVMDNLNTPKQGSRLNMAETGLNVINNHGLSARIPTIEQMREGTEAWNERHNKEACKINGVLPALMPALS
ncbi:MAG: transposase [Treponema sp.]|nr:transposase [Treponema sp.]